MDGRLRRLVGAVTSENKKIIKVSEYVKNGRVVRRPIRKFSKKYFFTELLTR